LVKSPCIRRTVLQKPKNAEQIAEKMRFSRNSPRIAKEHGCRRLHHRTNFQDYLVKVFGFSLEYAELNVIYERKFKQLLIWRISLEI
jgi:hypothetical protein